MVKFNKSQIMQEAWEKYRSPFLFKRFSGRAKFAKCLAAAWNQAKMIIESVISNAYYEAQAIARQSMGKVELLREEIIMLQFKSTRINITQIRRELEAQIERLAA